MMIMMILLQTHNLQGMIERHNLTSREELDLKQFLPYDVEKFGSFVASKLEKVFVWFEWQEACFVGEVVEFECQEMFFFIVIVGAGSYLLGSSLVVVMFDD